MAENQLQPSQNILNALQIFANIAWHVPSTFWRTHHSSGSRDIEYLHLQDHSVALQYLFGSAFAWYNTILIRDEYREALQALKTDGAYKQGVYIIGQPGIGKTSFLVYALLERLREHKPVAVQLRASEPFYVLLTNTCTPYALSDVAPLVQDGVWALSDLSTPTTSPLEIFQGVAATVIQTTLHGIKHWEWCDQDRDSPKFVMDIWSEDEVADLASLLGLDVEHMTRLSAKWGGVPRTLLKQSSNDESQQDWELSRAAAVVVENYTTLHSLDARDAGRTSAIFFVLPVKDRAGNIYHHRYIIRVPTLTLKNALTNALQQLQSKARIDFFLSMFGHPSTRTCVRNIYTNWFHSLMTPGRQLTSTWKSTSSCSYLCAPLGTTRDDSPTVLDHMLVDRDVTLNLPIVRNVAKPSTNPPYYWIPPVGEFPGVDCAIVTESMVTVIHLATHFQRSSPRIGLDKLQKLGLPVRQKRNEGIWYFLFVGIEDGLARSVYGRWRDKLAIPDVSLYAVDPAEIGIPDTPVVYTGDDELDGE